MLLIIMSTITIVLESLPSMDNDVARADFFVVQPTKLYPCFHEHESMQPHASISKEEIMHSHMSEHD